MTFASWWLHVKFCGGAIGMAPLLNIWCSSQFIHSDHLIKKCLAFFKVLQIQFTHKKHAYFFSGIKPCGTHLADNLIYHLVMNDIEHRAINDGQFGSNHSITDMATGSYIIHILNVRRCYAFVCLLRMISIMYVCYACLELHNPGVDLSLANTSHCHTLQIFHSVCPRHSFFWQTWTGWQSMFVI